MESSETRPWESPVRVSGVEWVTTGAPPQQPEIHVLTDRLHVLKERFWNTEENNFVPVNLEVFYRQQSSEHAASAAGVLSIADGVTGEYLLEQPMSPQRINQFVHAVGQYAEQTDNDSKYTVSFVEADTQLRAYTQDSLLIYSSEGELIPERSLIPTQAEVD